MSNRLRGQQLAVMRVLWKKGASSVADVQHELSGKRPLAYSTVATVLSRLEQKGLVTHQSEGRTYLYEPAITKNQVSTSLLRDVLEGAFGGSPTELVSHLLESKHVDVGELARIKNLIEEREAELKRQTPRRKT